MSLNIPIYRAKEIDSEVVVEGCITSVIEVVSASKDLEPLTRAWLRDRYETFEVDPLTVSIHFPDMIARDSDILLANGEKDLRIFASLSEDGRGGSIVLEDYKSEALCIFKNFNIIWKRSHEDCTKFDLKYESSFYGNVKITGIQT